MIQRALGRSFGRTTLCRLSAILAGTLFCSSTSQAASSGQFVIVSKGQPKVEILLEADQAERPVAFAAQELQRYVKEMSGAELAVVHAPSKNPSIALAVRPLQPDKKV